MNRKITLVIGTLLWFGCIPMLFAQMPLSLAEAIERGLQNSYPLQTAKLQQQVAANNNSWNAAGQYPNVNLNATYNNSFTGQNNPASFLQEFTSLSSGLNGNIDIGYTLFDGKTFKINKARFEAIQQQTGGNTQLAIETTIANVTNAYNNALIQKEAMATLRELLDLSYDRIRYQEARREFGQAGRFDLLQSEDAYFADSVSWLSQQYSYSLAIQNLLLAMGDDDVGQAVVLTDTLLHDAPGYDYENLREKLLRQNQSLANLVIAQNLTAVETRAAKSFRSPTLRANGGANLGTTFANLNVIKPETFPSEGANTSSNYNFYLNFTASYNLYNGGNVRRNIENALVQEKIAQLNTDDLKRSLSAQLQNTLLNYNNQRRLLAVVAGRVDNARANLLIAEERFRAAQLNSFDYRAVQLTYLNAVQSHLQVIFNIRSVETELLRLTGDLIQGVGN